MKKNIKKFMLLFVFIILTGCQGNSGAKKFEDYKYYKYIKNTDNSTSFLIDVYLHYKDVIKDSNEHNKEHKKYVEKINKVAIAYLEASVSEEPTTMVKVIVNKSNIDKLASIKGVLMIKNSCLNFTDYSCSITTISTK